MISDPLRSPKTAVIFAHALTGLGHLRVSHALYHGLPNGSHAYLLNSQDERLNTIHRIMSIHPWLRSVMEATQSGIMEDVFAYAARKYFRSHTGILVRQLQTIMDEHVVKPKTLLIVATHTFLGHQIAAIKDRFSRVNGITIVLVVVVTDDSPQHIWAVGGADLIIVPSELTKRNLERYHNAQKDMKHSLYIVDPYMVDPHFSRILPADMFARKLHAMNPDKLAPIHVSIPISGAAVQLQYFDTLMKLLDGTSGRFFYHIVSLQLPSTSAFLNRMIGKKNVSLYVSESHREVVDMHESLFDSNAISLEITKPSEQAFKAMCTPKQRGGAILLFTNPVGRQEHDNLKFLRRHRVIPSHEQQRALWHMSRTGAKISKEYADLAFGWRGLLMPLHSVAGADFIHWCLRERVLLHMTQFSGYRENQEMSGNGVAIFWRQITNYLRNIRML